MNSTTLSKIKLSLSIFDKIFEMTTWFLLVISWIYTIMHSNKITSQKAKKNYILVTPLLRIF